MKELLNYAEIAEVLGVSERTVRRMVAAKKIPVIRMSQRTLRFDKDKVLEALNKRKGK
jgi:excisionase family DNA binding protein